MDEDRVAYSTDDARTVAEYRFLRTVEDEYQERIRNDVAALGAGPQVMIGRKGIFPHHTERLMQIQQRGDFVPDGWRTLRSGYLQPRRGRPGELARAWLDERHPVNVHIEMERFGLPRTAWIPGDGSGWLLKSPSLFDHDGVLWSAYDRAPATIPNQARTCTWTPRDMADYRAARQAAGV